MSERIRWHDDGDNRVTGSVGTFDACTFVIMGPVFAGDEWVLMSRLHGQGSITIHGDSPEMLKPEAERLLAEFVTSLGAVFPEPVTAGETPAREEER